MPWANAGVAHLLSVCGMVAVKVSDGIAEGSGSDDCSQVMSAQCVETVGPFPPMWCQWEWEGPTLEDIITSWYKLCRLRVALCHGASPCKTCAWSWGREVEAVVVVGSVCLAHRPFRGRPQWPGWWWHSWCLSHPGRLSCGRG